METQGKREVLNKVLTELMDSAEKEGLVSFSVLSSQETQACATTAAIVGAPTYLAFALYMIMNESKQVYSIVKSAIDTYELAHNEISHINMVQKMTPEDFAKLIFSKVYNG
jgi:hypothetical protein